jgi:hypothetical protein
MTKSLRFALLSFVITGFTTGIVAAQKKPEASMRCREFGEDDRLSSRCEIKEQTLPAGGAITVDDKTNGGISIKGWERNEILVRSTIETRAPTQAEANQLAQQVRIETGALNIRAEGPEPRDDYEWFVRYEIFVPRRSDLSLRARNGGISISDVNGRIDFKTLNGGVNLLRVGGNVQGNTINGGVNVVLAGARWDGEGLDITTTNGGVSLVMPDNYSAHLETGTVNGNVSFGSPVNVPVSGRGRMPRDVSIDLGAGGPTVRVTTTNGGIRVGRSSGVE